MSLSLSVPPLTCYLSLGGDDTDMIVFFHLVEHWAPVLQQSLTLD